VNLNTIWYKQAGGQHTFKFGARYENIANEMASGAQYRRSGSPGTPPTRRATGVRCADVRLLAAAPDHHQGRGTSNNWSLWAQDSWSIGSKLTVNAGIRTENEVVPSYSGGAGIEYGFADKFALAWGSRTT